MVLLNIFVYKKYSHKTILNMYDLPVNIICLFLFVLLTIFFLFYHIMYYFIYNLNYKLKVYKYNNHTGTTPAPINKNII